jgi:diguanylate cyclase (GGDEF)-like protein
MVRARRRRWAGVTLVLVVLLGGTIGSLAVAIAVDREQQRHTGQLMDQNSDDVSRAVAGEISRYRDTLSDLAAAIGAESEFVAAGFTQITSRLSRQRLPGATGLVFAVPANGTQIAATQTYWRAHGAFGLRLTPVGTVAEHILVVFDRALDATPAVYGQDLSQAPDAAAALDNARREGQVTASASYVLVKDRSLPVSAQQKSFLLAAPVISTVGANSGAFLGWLVMAMRGGDFIDETLWTVSRGEVDVLLTDVSDSRPGIIADPSGRALSDTDRWVRERTIAVGNRKWQLRVYPTAAFRATANHGPAALAGGIGGLITVLLTALIGILASARNRAMSKVDQATTALREDIERRKTTEAQLRERENELRDLALHDPLTGLANRTLLYERLQHALTTHDRAQLTVAVLFIDLDGFKHVNDTLGHHVGDRVLTEVGSRLRRCVRANDTVARLGGDEFAILTEQIAGPEDAETIAGHVVRALQAPLDVDHRPVMITASVGVAVRSPDDRTADDILRTADAAMYGAKISGKDRYLLAAHH